MELRILGRVRLLGREPVPLGATKVRGLLGYLSFKANEFVHVDRIAEALWDGDGDAPADTGKVLQTYVSRLRRVLHAAGSSIRLTYEHRAYRLAIDPSIVDYHRFLAMVRGAQRVRGAGDHRTAADMLDAALALWDGLFLADLDTHGVRRLRDALTSRDLVPAHCALFDTRLSLGDHEAVLVGLLPLLSDHPTDERLASRWIRALAAAGRADEVPDFFRDFAGRLRADMAAPPSAELVRAAKDAMTHRPAPAFVPRRPGPPRVTPYFTGRESLLEQLDTLLTDHAVDVVALDGPPGIGKTALVRHWARLHAAEFPDGVLHADLAGYSDAPIVDPHAVMAMFLAELGVSPTSVPDAAVERAAQLRDLLSTRAVLVILDNARDSGHVRPLLEATSPCPALITSRQRLTGITYRDGVQLLSVPVLPAGDATALLAQRVDARAAADPAAFARLVELCRGLPLALRIVGEHVTMRPAVPLAELADELGHLKRLLDAGSHGDDHTTTLRSTFSLSYRALRPPVRRLFRLLGLHPGSRFSVDAANALAGADDVEPVLDALVGAHLVAQEGAGRYSIHDLLHVYAAQTARDEPDPDRTRATRRLFDWYLSSARRARMCLSADDQDLPELPPADPVDALAFADCDEALHWLVTERANLVACAYRAAELGYHEHVWRLSVCLHVFKKSEESRDLLDIHELGIRSARLVDNTAAVGGCLNNKGAVYARLNEVTDACRCFEAAYQEFAAAGDEKGLAAAMHNLWFLRLKQGQAAESITWLNKALAMNSRGGVESAVATGHRCLGDAHLMLGRVDEARSHYRLSLYSSQKSNDLAGQANSLSRLARLDLAENRLPEAVTNGEAALSIFDRVGVDQEGTAAALLLLATAHSRTGNHTNAITRAAEAVHRSHEIGDRSGQVDALILLGHAQSAAGAPADAADTWTAAGELVPLDRPARRSDSWPAGRRPGPPRGGRDGRRARDCGGHELSLSSTVDHVVPVFGVTTTQWDE